MSHSFPLHDIHLTTKFFYIYSKFLTIHLTPDSKMEAYDKPTRAYENLMSGLCVERHGPGWVRGARQVIMNSTPCRHFCIWRRKAPRTCRPSHELHALSTLLHLVAEGAANVPDCRPSPIVKQYNASSPVCQSCGERRPGEVVPQSHTSTKRTRAHSPILIDAAPSA